MDFERLMLRSWALGGSGFLSGVDWLTLLALLAVAAVYFLVPVLGYRLGQRGLLLASMWVLIGKMGMGVLKVCIVAMEALDPPKTGGSGSKTTENLIVLLSVFETGVFVLGIVLFVVGLSALRREMDLPRSLPRGFSDE